MSRRTRYVVNAAVLLLIGAHGVYRYAVGGAELASDGLGLALVVAQAVVGIAGGIWLLVRSRQVSG